MPREAALFDSTEGSLFLAYLALREEGKSMPPNWAKRSRTSRKNREAQLAKFLRAGKLDAANFIRDWELAYKKECFYRGITALMDLERHGKTRI